MLLTVGIAAMAAAVVLTALGIAAFTLTGRKLKRKLEEEYGKPPAGQK